MNETLPSERVAQVCLLIVAAVALFGGVLQMSLGQPETTPRLDNVHRFLAGVYLGAGVLGLCAALTIRRQGTVIYLLALMIFLGGIGRLVSMAKVGLPQPSALWLTYAGSELILPVIIVIAHFISTNARR